MDRELLLEIGCEELPAGWLPALTNQIGERRRRAAAARTGCRRSRRSRPTARRAGSPSRVARIAERQTDLEELRHRPAGVGQRSSPTARRRRRPPASPRSTASTSRRSSASTTPKGEYLAFRKRQRGKAAVDVLPDVLRRHAARPDVPEGDALGRDARGRQGRAAVRPADPLDAVLYGGRVVPFTIARTPAAQTAQVQDVSTGAVTYGHRFLTTSGRAGRAIKVRTFDEYRARLLENFVILERARAAQQDRPRARRQGAAPAGPRQPHRATTRSALLDEVPDLVEYPSVVAGTFALEFLELPEEVLTTTLIHHQHYFPVEGDDGKLKNAFLAVINTEPDNERTIARNAERVVTARLRDARFFWEADRKAAARVAHRPARHAAVPQEARQLQGEGGAHRDAGRVDRRARRFGADAATAHAAAQAARLAKADLATDMVREFTELQGTMGGIYAREEGQPEEVWKAIYFHYLPIGVEADAPPSRAQLGKAAVTWAAVSLADKLDTIVGLFAAGEKPTGSRDPFGAAARRRRAW